MNDYKHFIAAITNVVLGVVHIITGNEDNVKPQVSSFVKLIGSVKYEDGSYHAYYDEIKEVMKSFIIYWRESMDEAEKQAHCLRHKDVDKELMIMHVENTIRLWREYQNKFYKEFLPIESEQQQRLYDELTKKFESYMNQLDDIKERVEAMERREIVPFAHEQYAKSVEQKGKVFDYAHTYFSMLLADHLAEIRGSLKETRNRLRNNLKQLEDERETRLNDLLHQLYNKHKELQNFRRGRGSQVENVENPQYLPKINTAIDKIKWQVETSGNHEPIWRLSEDVDAIERRYAEFDKIANNLTKLKEELERTYREEAIYNSRTTTELPGSKFQCWQEMEKNFADRKEYLKQHIVEAAKALTTFFVVQSTTQETMTYHNNLGEYSVDFYGHVLYYFDYGLKRTHLDCTGKYRVSSNKNADYIDENGRYILKDNQKLYQLADCTSLYKLSNDTLLKKISTDCGHSEVTKNDCALSVKDPVVEEILPKTEPVDIKGTLDAETAKYLWDAFGAILPEALSEICELRPKNPIYHLAHSLLKHKYSKTPAEMLQKKIESEAYRANIFKKRKEKAAADSLAWRAKQVKRRKPEELDDSFNRVVYDIYVATQEFITSLDYYN